MLAHLGPKSCHDSAETSEEGWFNTNKYTASVKSPIYSCISPTISAVIHVTGCSTKWVITDLMSRSQICTIVGTTLTNAWLNL